MARTTTETKVAPEVPMIGKKFENAVIQAQDSSLHPAEVDAVFAAGVDIGRIEAADFFLTVGTSVILSVYENVKKSKSWRHIRNSESSHGEKFKSLEEFCEVFATTT